MESSEACEGRGRRGRAGGGRGGVGGGKRRNDELTVGGSKEADNEEERIWKQGEGGGMGGQRR